MNIDQTKLLSVIQRLGENIEIKDGWRVQHSSITIGKVGRVIYRLEAMDQARATDSDFEPAPDWAKVITK